MFIGYRAEYYPDVQARTIEESYFSVIGENYKEASSHKLKYKSACGKYGASTLKTDKDWSYPDEDIYDYVMSENQHVRRI
jgi:hypothetical protein